MSQHGREEASEQPSLPFMEQQERGAAPASDEPERHDAGALIPDEPTLPTLREAAAECKACNLWTRGTQTVFGEGERRATVMFVGEQPGDKEDVAGRPFVGPAGQLFDQALREVGLDRGQAYVTNVVKHFKWLARGKRRIHEKPNSAEIDACRPWLDAEIALVKPEVIVCLGATAAQALLGRQFRVTRQRGELIPSPLAPYVMATVHPSSILRAEDDETREIELERFVADLRKVADLVYERYPSGRSEPS
jgi:uracil-DNA glycosylase family protein